MFGRQLKLKQARLALRDGRLEEAFKIVTEESLRDHRSAQALLDDLVSPLLKRSSEHLEAGRLEDALVDAERALEAGGNRPETSEQRDSVLEAIRTRKAGEERTRSLLDSARRHLRNGSLHATRDRLEQVAVDDSATTGILRATDENERQGAAALERAKTHLERNEILEAVDATQSLLAFWGRNDNARALLADLKTVGTRSLLQAFEGGDLHLAITLHERLRAVLEDSVELRRFDEALGLSQQAQRSFGDADYDGARTALGRLDKLFPGVTWIVDALADLAGVADGLRSLRTGPLGDLDRLRAKTPDLNVETQFMGNLDRSDPVAARPTAHVAQPESASHRSLLWIDGLGTYLILPADRVSIGRIGSTARPDLALTADLAGYHAEISRTGEDYFVTAVQGDVRVGGKKVQKTLLSHDDSIDLGNRCRVQFGQPTGMSSTALLSLRKGMRIEGDVKTIVLLDDNLIIGPGSNCHIRAPMLERRFLIQKQKGGLRCRAEKGVVIDGEDGGIDVGIESGKRLQVENLTFTLTGVSEQV